MKTERFSDSITLYNGDARAYDFDRGFAHMIWTDPPYGHNNNDDEDLISVWERATGRGSSPKENFRPIANDKAEDTQALMEWFFEGAPLWLNKGGAACCVCCGGGGGVDPQFARWSIMMDKHLKFKQAVVWDKGPMGLGWHYKRSYEFVLVGEKKGGKSSWYDTSKRVENIIRPGDYGIRKIIPSADDHPTPKPVELSEHFIRLHTTEGQTVFDPFMGGGSTGVAAVRNGRGFVGVEINPQFFDMACRRIESALSGARSGQDMMEFIGAD